MVSGSYEGVAVEEPGQTLHHVVSSEASDLVEKLPSPRRPRRRSLAPYSPHYQRAAELIGGRWTGAILRAMTTGLSRFSDLRDAIPGLSDRMLSERLRELETEKLIVRIVIPTVPVRIEYHLTERGDSLRGVIISIAEWAETSYAFGAGPLDSTDDAARGGQAGSTDRMEGHPE